MKDDLTQDAALPDPDRAKARAVSASKNVALIAVLSAMVVGGKYALQWIPNVEVVTILLMTFTFALGLWRGIVTAVVFCLMDMLLYPFSFAVTVAYFIYWPFILCPAAWLVNAVGSKRKNPAVADGGAGKSAAEPIAKQVRSAIANAFAAAGCSFLFGIVTTLSYSIIAGAPFIASYVPGVLFFALHIVSNFLIVLFAFKPLSKLLFKLKTLYRFVGLSNVWQ
ncbi:MAG: hypothetical protein LBL66_04050 [Clostridiales bacterium]|jgi:hypothetical protein|nr:hypothetical protein [Clostridiales bacterium]